MCKSLVWRGLFVGTLLLLFTAGVASGQMSPFPVQNTIAWGGPIPPPDVGSADKGPQTPVPTPVQPDPNAQSSADAPADTPDADQTASPAGNVDNSTASSASDNNTVRQLGTPFPLQLQPQGLKIGPFYVPSISDAFYYAVNDSPGQPTQTFVGNSVTANLIYSKALSNGVLVVQAREQMSLANSVRPVFNQSISATYNDQLSERWSLNANANFTYFQSSILANPQYLLAYNNAGSLQQTVFVPQAGSVAYETNNITFNYALNGRTHLTLSPIIGATFSGQEGQPWNAAYQFGGAVGVNRDFTPNLNLGVFYALSHSVTSGSSSPGWNNQNIGMSFSYKFGQSWSVNGSLAASGQLVAQVWTLTPTGTLRLMKSFGRSSIIAAFTRSEASDVFVSKGYYQQADVGYNLNLSRRMGANVGVGQWQTVNTGFNQHGWRASGSTSYQLTPRLSVNGAYSYSHVEGVQTASFAPYLGNTNTFSVGLTWFLGARSGL